MMAYDDEEEYLPFLTTYDAAAILGVTYRRVIYLIKTGRLKATRLNREWLLRKEDIAALKLDPRYRPRRRPPGYTRAMRESGYMGRRRKHERKEQSNDRR